MGGLTFDIQRFDEIFNTESGVSIVTGGGDDSIYNADGASVTVDTGDGRFNLERHWALHVA